MPPVFYSFKLENSKKMKILSMQLFLVVILAMAVNAAWKSGNNGLVNWDYNCDFHEPKFPAIDTKPSNADQCGGVCIANPRCKYFVHRDGRCWLKGGPRSSGDKGRSRHAGAICGFVFDRTWELRSSWHSLVSKCSFNKRDFPNPKRCNYLLNSVIHIVYISG